MGRNSRKNNYVSNYQDGRRTYQGHDDRGFDQPSRIRDRLGTKQVGFVDGVRGGSIQKRNRGGPPRALNHIGLLPDDDLDLDVETRSDQAGRGRPVYGRSWRGGMRRGGSFQRNPMGKPALVGGLTWHKMTLRNGAKYDKMLLLKEILQRSAVKFVPICYQAGNTNSTFFIEEPAAARAIKDLDKKIELPDGFDLIISMERTTPPNMPVSQDMLDKIKVVMSERYNAGTSALNLNAFHNSFSGTDFYVPLNRTNILSKVVDIIVENIPEVRAIDLSNNRLMNLDALTGFKNRLKQLSILYLKDNKLADLRGIDKLKGIDLKELKLDGNPCKDRLGAAYTDSVRKIFPALQVLDDKVLPKEIGFEDDVAEKTDIPASIPKLVKNESAGGLVLQFLEQFFKLYDTDNRQPLLDAYDENAMMSLSCMGSFEQFKNYMEESRNLKRITTEHKRLKLLRKGRLPIVSFMSGLPKTQHDPTTFTLDLPFTSETLMIFTVTGMFRERETKLKAIRHFNRCFIVVPRGSGFCIINEVLHITNPTELNKRRAFTSPESSMQTLNKPEVADISLDPASKQTLASAFSELTGMNLDWSARALEENRWNYDKASSVFLELKASGKVPPEAFIK
jgi:nuclear RNA export factor